MKDSDVILLEEPKLSLADQFYVPLRRHISLQVEQAGVLGRAPRREIEGRHLAAVGGEPANDRLADAAGAAGDERHAVTQPGHDAGNGSRGIARSRTPSSDVVTSTPERRKRSSPSRARRTRSRDSAIAVGSMCVPEG